jgi:Planctomycete cytochrome C
LVRRVTRLNFLMFLILLLGLAIARPPVCPAAGAAGPADADRVGFSREVRPILARHCFKCHGPDDKARKAHLRLDRREDAVKEAGSGLSPIVPGRPDESEVISRIFRVSQNPRLKTSSVSHRPARRAPESGMDVRAPGSVTSWA